MKSNRFPLSLGLALAAMIAFAGVAQAVKSPPDVDPANFTCSNASNPLFPLVPGTTWTYQGEEEGVPASNIVEVTCGTLLIDGVTTTVVHDRAFENGVLVEDTFDYFATDCDGNVWYFGEDTTSIPSGSTEGSWRAGVNDADAGFIMLASPEVGDRYFQEFAPPKVAIDQAKVIDLDGSTCTLFTGCVDGLLVTKETSQLDPGVVENKYYLSGIGFIRADTVKGGDETSALVSFTPGAGCGN